MKNCITYSIINKGQGYCVTQFLFAVFLVSISHTQLIFPFKGVYLKFLHCMSVYAFSFAFILFNLDDILYSMRAYYSVENRNDIARYFALLHFAHYGSF